MQYFVCFGEWTPTGNMNNVPQQRFAEHKYGYAGSTFGLSQWKRSHTRVQNVGDMRAARKNNYIAAYHPSYRNSALLRPRMPSESDGRLGKALL